MNEEKAKILLRLYKEDLITVDEFLILCKEEVYLHTNAPNFIPIQPFINNPPYYTTGTGTINSNNTSSFTPNLSTHQHSTISSSFSKKWINPEEL